MLNAHYHNKQYQLSTFEILQRHGERNICSPSLSQPQLIRMKTDENQNPHAGKPSNTLNNFTALCTHTAATVTLIAATGCDIDGVESDSCN